MSGYKTLILTGALIWLLTSGHACSRVSGQGEEKRLLVLGMDGLDPRLMGKLMEEGQLPAFAQLKAQGGFRVLGTTVPPLSPVAWSTFITGTDPGGHGIFDFIHRDPTTLKPYLSTSRTEPGRYHVRLGEWAFPLAGGQVSLLRKGRAFWELLDEQGVATSISRIPANFPPVETGGRSLSGMGTPDLLGTYGTFSVYTDHPPVNPDEISGGRVYPVTELNHRIEARLYGPTNSFRARPAPTTVDFAVWVDPEQHVAKLAVQGQEILLKEGEWSEWLRVEFPLIPSFKSVSGIFRAYLKEVHPHFMLYVTPINLDPQAPALPIATPPSYAGDLARSIGLFYTQGMAEDTKAFNAHILDEREYLTQVQAVLSEQIRMLRYELERFQSGLLFFYISTTDLVPHMFWAPMDPRHPGHDPQVGRQYHDVIENVYRQMDRLLASVLARLDDRTTVLVMSDHGFAPFYRQFHLNTWLLEEGYLVLRQPVPAGERTLLSSVDWSRTRAYGLGLNGLYVNLKGRESQGSVDPKERGALVKELADKLMALRDPASGEPVVARAYKAEDIYSAPYAEHAPDIVMGYNRGYRSSNKTALGEIPEAVLSDNKERWSGDHAMAADLVPGVVFSNRKIAAAEPTLADLTVTILTEFGVSPDPAMKGKSIF
jgi:predicted AlkP superfamily phosphohydrolase/phosphomutase